MFKSWKEIADCIRPIFHNKPVKQVIIFGSWARGTQDKRSDLDLIIIEDTEKRFFQRYDDFNELFERLGSLEIDMLIYTPKEFESMLDRSFIREAVDNGKLIYER